MNSFSHYAIGAVGEWMVRTILGINPDPSRPGFEHFFLKPLPGGGLTWAKGSYRSHHGIIAVEWKTSEEGALAVKFEIPANTNATVELPAASTSSVTESGKPLAQALGASGVESKDGVVRMELGSGNYHFEVVEK
jgi:alpha-L-rhamnosidase